jgi:hypothetical protein
VDENEVTKTTNWLKSTYGEDMYMSRGKKHDYLGMELYFSVSGEVKVSMAEYLKIVIYEFPYIITGYATSPATNHLFSVRPETKCKPIIEQQGFTFHHCVEHLLFASTHSRKDIQPTVAFLITRVLNPDKDDWEKLKRLLRYTRNTMHTPLITRDKSFIIVKWWVDASFVTHDDFRRHTGAMMPLGRGSIIGMPKKWKQRADGVIAPMMWKRYLLDAQCFKVEESLLDRDTMSTMLLETNGRQSSSNWTKHVRYFFIKDRVDNKEITLNHCPTGEMLSDHFTKPLQGALFRKLRAEIQGIPVDMNEYCRQAERRQLLILLSPVS